MLTLMVWLAGCWCEWILPGMIQRASTVEWDHQRFSEDNCRLPPIRILQWTHNAHARHTCYASDLLQGTTTISFKKWWRMNAFIISFRCWSPIKVWRWVWSLIRNNVGVYTAPPPIHSHPNSDTLSPRKAFNNILFPFRMICFCQDILSKILWLLFLQTFVSCFQNSWHWKGLDRNKIWINTGTVLLYE